MKNLILALLILAGTVHAQSLIVISGSKTAIAPAGITRVNQVNGLIASISGSDTATLGFTVAATDALVCGFDAVNPSGTATMTANGTSMTTAVALFTDGGTAQATAAFFLPNAGGKTSVVIATSGMGGASGRWVCTEYAGVSTTATVVNTAVTGYTGSVASASWSNGAYTATSGDLCLGFTGAEYANGGGTWTANSPFATVSGQSSSDGNNPTMLMGDILGSTAGSVTWSGTYPPGAGGERYNYATVCIK